MDIIGTQKIWTFAGDAPEIVESSCSAVRKSEPVTVQSYMDLATKIAALQFRNRDFVLMFRGQNGDYRDKGGRTSLKSSLMRASISRKVPSANTIESRFQRLKDAETALVREYKLRGLSGVDRMERQQIMRWSILQHYEICPTPLLDVTHSLRIGASFASNNANGGAYLFVLGVPHISGAITASAEAGLQIVRLSSVCPPSAVRPHIQEGYLLGEYPDFSNAEQKQHYAHFEMDFGRRLIAKFKFHPELFWNKSTHFPRVPPDALYPRAFHDPMFKLAEAVKAAIDT